MTTIDERDTGVALPGEAPYEEATRVFNLVAPARPAAAVTVRTVEDIRAALRLATVERMPVRVHTTGHASATARPMDGALLIRTRMAGAVEIDPVRRLARVPAGTSWGEVVAASSAHGLIPPHGSSPDVGVVGYLLRGGMSFYSRRAGLAVNSVRAVELVTADGEWRRVDAATDPELFWALRGGGGGFGVVTAVEVELFPVARVVTGAAFWPAEHAPALLRAWRRWTEDAPWEAATSARVMNLPPLPDVPPVLAAGPMLCVDGVVLAADEDAVPAALAQAEDLLGPLRAVAEPVMDTFELTTPAMVLQAHMDPSDPVPIVGDHMLLGEIGDDGVAELLRVIGPGSGSPLVVAGLRQLGGAYAVADPAGGVLSHFDARFAYSGAGVPEGGLTREAILAHCATVREALAPFDTGRTAPTFVERFDQPQGHLTADQVVAVDRVRARVDPAGLFRQDTMRSTTALI
ncbi:FAD-linked oxidase [Sphaerisporangium melleum]|uniref:FAD-linked oxidase n=1 Tax=Sphaerisporangium melleum TaxID=321316 RepID=A0A917VKN3_9ACTN|nr:FAD-dependent oxidoreductase [Sphaerisporangium melleum]GGK90949.1 FAD-linked oxidase [Sphaerisporangium melleum]GII72800.1 FAD-linked oxidase [Sphaerisporangium melleum]